MSSSCFAGVFGVQERRAIPTQREKTSQAFDAVADVLDILADLQASLAECRRSNAAAVETSQRLTAPQPLPPKYLATIAKSATPPPPAPTKPVLVFKVCGNLLEAVEIGRRPA